MIVSLKIDLFEHSQNRMTAIEIEVILFFNSFEIEFKYFSQKYGNIIGLMFSVFKKLDKSFFYR